MVTVSDIHEDQRHVRALPCTADPIAASGTALREMLLREFLGWNKGNKFLKVITGAATEVCGMIIPSTIVSIDSAR